MRLQSAITRSSTGCYATYGPAGGTLMLLALREVGVLDSVTSRQNPIPVIDTKRVSNNVQETGE